MNTKLVLAARLLLGLIFFVFGLNKFLNFLPPLSYNPDTIASAFLSGLFHNNAYLIYLLGATEVLVGTAFLSGKYVPLALIIIAPVTMNILLFHLSLDPAGGGPGYFTFALNWFLFFAYKKRYEPLLKP
ncbi:MAG: DoxX family membrane protein [Bacteroidota bacterium]